MSGHDADRAEAADDDAGPGSGPGALERLDAWVEAVRANSTRRRAALAVGVVLGLVAATVHWVGLVAGGALVGLSQRSLSRALLAGLGFGLLVLGVFFVVTPVVPGDLLVLAPLSSITVGLALVAPVWGALARAIV